jgi:uncharacterized protein with PQ loop repeat
MSLFQKKTYQSDQEKKLSVMIYWLFVVAVFAWVIPFTLLFVLGMVNQALGFGSALSFALTPSLVTFAVSCILCVAVYFGYKKLVLKV